MQVETYPALPDLSPKATYRVFACAWIAELNEWGRWHTAGWATSLPEARKLTVADANAVRSTYGGLIAAPKGPRVYRVFHYGANGPEQVGEDIIR